MELNSILTGAWIVFVIALSGICLYIILLLNEFRKTMIEANNILKKASPDISSMVHDAASTTHEVTSLVNNVTEKIKRFTTIFEVLGVVGKTKDIFSSGEGKEKKSRIKFLSLLAGIKKGLDVFLSTKKNTKKKKKEGEEK